MEEIKKGFNQIEFCNYMTKDELHSLENNIGYIEVKETFKDLINTCAFLRCCAVSGEKITEEEATQIGNKIIEAKKLI
jgi:hypothetical protein